MKFISLLFLHFSLKLVEMPCSCALSVPAASTRRDILLAPPSAAAAAAAASVLVVAPQVAGAFEGSGSSSYSGRTPLAVAAKAKGYRDRVAADVKDFNNLGAAIDKGENQGQAWVSFFIPYQRREPDAVGRAYAARVDLVGLDQKSAGGSGLLLAGTYAKPNKPPDNLVQFKKYTALAKTLEPINEAGKAGDARKAKRAWSKAAAALSEYLESVDMPPDLADPLYS